MLIKKFLTKKMVLLSKYKKRKIVHIVQLMVIEKQKTFKSMIFQHITTIVNSNNY